MNRPGLIIYDGDCGFCTSSVRWVLRRAEPGAFEALACQSEERARRAPGVSLEQCLQAVQLVAADGSIYAGAAAFPHILARVPRWRWAGRMLRAPIVRQLSPLVYAWVARRRKCRRGTAGD